MATPPPSEISSGLSEDLGTILDPSSPDPSTENANTPPTRAQRILKNVGWGTFAFVCLLVFTFLKLPDDRIKNYIDGTLAVELGKRGISYTAAESHLSFLWGPFYSLKNVTLNYPPPSPTAHIDKVEVSPSFLPLLLGRLGGQVWIYNGDSRLQASFSASKSRMSGSFKAKKFDLGKTGLMSLGGVKGSAILDGEGSFGGEMSNAGTLDGTLQLNLSKIVLNPQVIQGFSIPKVSMSEGVVDVSAERGKILIKTLRLGKPDSADDLKGSATGDLTLGRQWDSGNINLKCQISLSDSLKKSFILLDAILGAGKKADGSYVFGFSGPLEAPSFSAGDGTGSDSGPGNGAAPAGNPNAAPGGAFNGGALNNPPPGKPNAAGGGGNSARGPSGNGENDNSNPMGFY